MVVRTDVDEAFFLALLNTTPVIDGVSHDELGDDRSAARWIAEHADNPPKRTDFALLRSTRDALQQVIRGHADPAVLSPALRRVNYHPMIRDNHIEWQSSTPSSDELAALAVVTWDYLQTNAPGRVRACANTECNLFLIDRSKGNSARWCSMSSCGNRLKARRHYRRQSGSAV
ncbi:CGNR zinc finger domain-containing protein [Mycobacterium sp. MUNTM1]